MTPPHRLVRRRRWRRFLGWTVVAALIVAGGVVGLLVNTAPGEGSDPTNRDQRAVAFVEEQLRAQGTPDAAFAVVRDGEVSASGALGDGTTNQSPFLLGSLSKPFTSLAIMQLVEQGAVALDDPVTDHIPWFTTADPDTVITLRHLLNQTSGLPTWAGQTDLQSPETTLEERVRAVADVEPVRDPGKAYEYCNKNFAVLGLVVQEASGMPYADYLQQHVLEPLDMSDSFTDMHEAKNAGLVDGASVWFGAHVPREPSPYPGALPDGYVVSTVDDLAHFAQAQATGTYQGQPVLSQQALERMYSPPPEVPADEFYDAKYALGWRVRSVEGQEAVFHEGEVGTYGADLAILPEDGSALVILTAHNTMLTDLSTTHTGGLAVLAGAPAPAIDHSYFTAYLAVLVVGAGVVTALFAAAVGLIARARRLPLRIRDRGWARVVVVPVLGHLFAATAIYVLVFFGLGQAMGQPGFLRLSMAYDSVPDVTSLLVAVVGYQAAAAVVILGAGLRARLARPTSAAGDEPGLAERPIATAEGSR